MMVVYYVLLTRRGILLIFSSSIATLMRKLKREREKNRTTQLIYEKAILFRCKTNKIFDFQSKHCLENIEMKKLFNCIQGSDQIKMRSSIEAQLSHGE